MFIVEVKHKISMKNGQCKFTISRALFLELYTSYLGTTENTKQKNCGKTDFMYKYYEQ